MRSSGLRSALLLVSLCGCVEVPDGDFDPAPPEDIVPTAGWSVGFTPRGKPAEDVLRGGFGEGAAAEGFLGGAVIAGFSEDVLASTETLDSARSLLEDASAIQIVVPWYQDSVDSSTFSREPGKTPTDASLTELVEAVHDVGGRVLLSLFVEGRDGSWRGQFLPADPDAWFASHRALQTHYGALAEELGVAAMSVGSEYSQTESRFPDQWRAVIAANRAEFSGLLTYSANWSDTDGAGGGFEGVPFWDDLDVIGVDAWFPLIESGEAPEVELLVAGWQPWLNRMEAVSQEHDRPVWFTEVGYASRVGAAARPWEWQKTDEPSAVTQENGYKAFFEAVYEQEEWVQGAFFWWWDNASTWDFAGY